MLVSLDASCGMKVRTLYEQGEWVGEGCSCQTVDEQEGMFISGQEGPGIEYQSPLRYLLSSHWHPHNDKSC